MISFNEISETIMFVFVIAILGYLLGSVKIKGLNLGNAGIFIIGLIFGHFGVILPAILQTLGAVFFITAVGFGAGPGFIRRLKRNGFSYAVLCLSTAAIGSIICWFIIRAVGIEAPLAVGIMTGAFTTSPGFAAAKEAAQSPAAAAQVAAGYGLVYPVGVTCKVLLIQLIPRFLRADMAFERTLIKDTEDGITGEEKGSHRIDKLGICFFSLAALFGILLGAVMIPLPGQSHFSLGTTGGPLLMAVIISCIGKLGPIDMHVEQGVIAPAKEFGLLLFFSGAGVEGGHGVAKVLSEYGLLPLIYGFFFVIIPFFAGVVLFRRILKLHLLNGLGAMTASMTCTPSLAMLTQIAETDDVAAAYATTYPIALITLILVVQILIKL